MQKPKMEIVLSKSPDFDAVFAEQAREQANAVANGQASSQTEGT